MESDALASFLFRFRRWLEAPAQQTFAVCVEPSHGPAQGHGLVPRKAMPFCDDCRPESDNWGTTYCHRSWHARTLPRV